MTQAAIFAGARVAAVRSRFSRYEKLLLGLFLLTLPLVNPWVRGDGIGYYAYARALLIQGNLNFESDWLAGNRTFLMSRVDASGRLQANQYTPTGRLNNLFSVGPAILWAPFLAGAHSAVLGLNKLGAQIPADGFSRPYRVTMAVATASYAFLGLLLAFRLAQKYFDAGWALLATLGIWFGSSLPVYMYFNPSWAHAHSAFAVSLFLWYWHDTRGARTPRQWILLGLLAGLMINVYYLNGVLLLVPLLEALTDYGQALRTSEPRWRAVRRLFAGHLLFVVVTLMALLPTFVTRKLIFGQFLRFGAYTQMHWNWTSPALGSVLFSSEHGLLSWTPILLPALLGLVLLRRHDPCLGTLLLAAAAFYYVIASYPYWDGLSSFGNRFFVSLTPVFILGLAASLEWFGKLFARRQRAFAAAGLLIGLLAAWNAGFIFQWGTHLVPARGPISWRVMVHNQFAVVPRRLTGALKTYLVGRQGMMQRIEQEDLKQLRSQTPAEE